MRKLVRFFSVMLLLLLGGASANAQLLWEISGNGLKEKSYLFGTHHLVPISFLDSIPYVYKAYNRCTTVVGEIVVNDGELVEKIQKGAEMHGTSMHSLYDDADYDAVDAELKRVLKIGLKELAILKPGVVESLYLQQLYANYMNPEQSEWQIDSFFQEVADKNNRPIKALETADEQCFLLFDLISLERQAEVLKYVTTNPKKMVEHICLLDSLYRKQDIEGLYKLTEVTDEPNSMTEQERFLMIDARNQAWARKIPPMLHEGSCFIAVGAIHLPGYEGLIKQLRRMGYRVRPIMSVTNIK